MVADPRDDMSRFFMGVPYFVEEESQMIIIFCDMDISYLMVFTWNTEMANSRKKIERQKALRPVMGISPMLSMTGKVYRCSHKGIRVNILPKYLGLGKIKVVDVHFLNLLAPFLGDYHVKFLTYTKGCYECWKSEHKMRDWEIFKDKSREDKKVSTNAPNESAKKKNVF